MGFSLVVASGGAALQLLRAGVSLQWLLVAEHGLWGAGFSRCGAWAQQPWLLGSRVVVEAQGLRCSMARGNLPSPGIEPLCPALAGRFSATEPAGKP